MASYKNYQQDEQKYKNVDNIMVRKAKTGRKDTKSESFWSNFIEYVTYYRDNPHRFCSEYLGLRLHWWQQLVLYTMWTKESTIFIAGRGAGKTYLVMMYCVCKALLFPGTVIRVASANKKQAGFLIAKIKEMKRNSPMLEREIVDISIGKDEAKIIFQGGSEVATVVAGDGARGERSNIVIVDEREIVDKEVIDKVFLPFLTAKRTPPYLSKKEYKKFEYLEQNHFIEMSSIGSSSSSMYKEYLQYLDFISKGINKYAVFSIPYQIPLRSGVVNKSIIEKMVRESTTSLESFRQEMECLPTGEGISSMFSFEELNKNRKLRVPLIPITDDEYIEYKGDIKKSLYYQKKQSDELRIISYDIARSGGRGNDLSVFTVFRCIQNGDFYDKEVAYIETMSGVETEAQILRFKELFYDLECDFAVQDAAGIGKIYLDFVCKKTFNPMRNITYPAWRPRNNLDKYSEDLVILPDSEPVLYAVLMAGATAQIQQALMIQKTRINLEKKRIKFLIDEDEAVYDLQKRYKYEKLKSSKSKSDNDVAKKLILPFLQTSNLIKEGISTQVINTPSGGVSIDEKAGRKDRLMSFLYGILFIDLLEQDLTVKEEKYDPAAYIITSQAKSNNSINRFGTSFKGFRR